VTALAATHGDFVSALLDGIAPLSVTITLLNVIVVTLMPHSAAESINAACMTEYSVSIASEKEFALLILVKPTV